MAKDPAFPFYASDFFMDTLTWSEDHVGAWTRILAYLWINGPSTPESLYKVSSNAKAVLEHCQSKMEAYADGKISNIKLEKARQDRETNRAKRSAKASKAAKARWDKSPSTDSSSLCSKHTTSIAREMPFKEKENENEKERELEKEGEQISKIQNLKSYTPAPTFQSEVEQFLLTECKYPINSGERTAIMKLSIDIETQLQLDGAQITLQSKLDAFRDLIHGLDDWTKAKRFNMNYISDNIATLYTGKRLRAAKPTASSGKPSALDQMMANS